MLQTAKKEADVTSVVAVDHREDITTDEQALSDCHMLHFKYKIVNNLTMLVVSASTQ